MPNYAHIVLALEIIDRLQNLAIQAIRDGRDISDEELAAAVEDRKEGVADWESADSEAREDSDGQDAEEAG